MALVRMMLPGIGAYGVNIIVHVNRIIFHRATYYNTKISFIHQRNLNYFHTIQLTIDTPLGSKEVKLNVIFKIFFFFLF